MPNGEKIKHITVGGRTSAVVESRQKKIKSNDEQSEDEGEAPAPKKAKKVKAVEEVKEKTVKGKKGNTDDVAEEKSKRKTREEVEDGEVTPKKRRVTGKKETNGSAKSTPARKSSRSKAS